MPLTTDQLNDLQAIPGQPHIAEVLKYANPSLNTDKIRVSWYNEDSLESCGNNSPSLINSNFIRGKIKMTVKNISKICSVVDCGEKHRAKGMCQTHYLRWVRYGDVNLTKINKGVGKTSEERFWNRVKKDANEKGCWEWQGSTNEHGYGRVGYQNRYFKTHILSWFLTYGKMPENNLLHDCDNPPCCNPKHLHEGTKAQNSAEMVSRGRSAKGEKHSQARLTDEKVLDIRYKSKQGKTMNALAIEHQVSSSTISRVVNRQIWTHI